MEKAAPEEVTQLKRKPLWVGFPLAHIPPSLIFSPSWFICLFFIVFFVRRTYRYPRGESMLDLLTRLDPVIHEIERARDPLLIVAHRVMGCVYAGGVGRGQPVFPHADCTSCSLWQSVLNLLYCYLTDQPRHRAPQIKACLESSCSNFKLVHRLCTDTLLHFSFVCLFICLCLSSCFRVTDTSQSRDQTAASGPLRSSAQSGRRLSDSITSLL